MRRALLSLLLLMSMVATYGADTLKVGITEDNYPFSYVDSASNVQGIVVDWWNLWGRSNHREILFSHYETSELLFNALEKNDVSVLGGSYVTPQWSEQLLFGASVVRSKIVIYGTKPAINLDSLSDSIGVVDGAYAYSVVSEKFPLTPLKVYPSFHTLLQDVSSESITFFVDDQPREISRLSTPRSRFNKNPLIPKSYQYTEVLAEESYRTAVLRGEDSLAQFILIGTNNMSDDDMINLAHSWNLLQQVSLVTIVVGSAIVTGLIIFVILMIRRKRKAILSDHPSTLKVSEILKKGETSTVEFKSSLRYDYRQQCSNKALEQVIVKTIAAFLNSSGGVLVIGVDDEGSVLGLENDYQSLNKKNSDGFLLALTALINNHIGKNHHRTLALSIIEIDHKEICWVKVRPSTEPVFVGKGGKEEFYIRASVSSQPLSIRECHEYIVRQWKLRSPQ